ncbi:MAG: zeta toxin family protein [Hylemonella sp.]|uniref:zeta toxin family protein n=1 Tax=Hylemonella sp. TaxID=2066020 RepID=UPI0022CC42C6|nr:zeta toxin family protein [Hylemonella sp.]MCZ8251726.1 zeta toxin family protein [Hylemonella sp.]
MAPTRAASPRRRKDKPVLYLIAGPNGAGKTTLYRALLLTGTLPADAEFVNADHHEALHLQHIPDPLARSKAAQAWAEARRAELLQTGQSFVSETVFSHPSKLALITEAQAQGYFVMLLVVALEDPQQLLERVAQRVREGGHAVPQERILARYPRTLAHLTRAVRLADAAVLYDSQDVTPGAHTAVALCKKAWTQELVQPLPGWAQRVLWGQE